MTSVHPDDSHSPANRSLWSADLCRRLRTSTDATQNGGVEKTIDSQHLDFQQILGHAEPASDRRSTPPTTQFSHPVRSDFAARRRTTSHQSPTRLAEDHEDRSRYLGSEAARRSGGGVWLIVAAIVIFIGAWSLGYVRTPAGALFITSFGILLMLCAMVPIVLDEFAVRVDRAARSVDRQLRRVLAVIGLIGIVFMTLGQIESGTVHAGFGRRLHYGLDATARAVIMILVGAFVGLGVGFVRNRRRNQRSKEQ
jgi:hypothetical protein